MNQHIYANMTSVKHHVIISSLFNPQWKDNREKYNIQSDIKPPLGKYCEVEWIIKFIRR